MVREHFPVWSSNEIRFADLVAFTQAAPAPQDMTTAAIAGVIGNGALAITDLSIARELAAPTAIVARDDGLELWWVGVDAQEKLRDVRYDDVDGAAVALRPRLSPASVRAAKDADSQMGLFPTDVAALLRRARWSTRTRLQARVEIAMDLATTRAVHEIDGPEGLDRASRLVIGAMAALMISDKLEPARSPSESVVIETAAKRYPSYFGWTRALDADDRATLGALVNELGRDISYAGLDPAVVAHVYVTALVSAAAREELGIYYTPPELAKAVLEQLPIEDLDPRHRSVLDPACGSGTLLLAAYERLRGIAPPELGVVDRHEHASTLLRGFDADPFAVQIAGLELLLNALPQGNGWQVSARDVIADPAVGIAADIVVSNPPWLHQPSFRGRRTQVADAFIDGMLATLKPGGILAAILPAPWLSAHTTQGARQRLRESCDIFEIWRLPEDTFPGAEMAPVVLFAQHRPEEGRYIFRRALRRKDWKDQFLSRERNADIVLLSSARGGLWDETLLRGPLDGDAETLKSLPTLKALLSDLGPGPVPTPPVSDRGGQGPFRWLRKHPRIPTLTSIPDDCLVPVRYPDEFERRSDDGERYKAPKVLVSAVRKADNPWRLRVLLDRVGGVIPRQSLFVVTPADQDDLDAIAALLLSSVAAAWIDTLNPSRSIEMQILGALPVPSGKSAWSELRRIGRNLTDRAEQGVLRSSDLRSLDELVCELYGLSGLTRARLIAHFSGFKGPEGDARYPTATSTAAAPAIPGTSGTLRHYGAVMDVSEQQIRLWVPDLTSSDGDWLALPRRFLGRHVRPGATFEVDVVLGDLANGFFQFQTDSYLDLHELAVGLG
jgi:SAM-dependent methyltransferase